MGIAKELCVCVYLGVETGIVWKYQCDGMFLMTVIVGEVLETELFNVKRATTFLNVVEDGGR